MKVVAGAASDVGRVREGNEDSYLVDDAMGLFVVADGMGGHRAGEIASATAVEALRSAVRNGTALRDAVVDANDAVFAKSLTDPSLRGMGTTLTAGTLVGDASLALAHVGDSRAFLLRDGELTQLTVDHTLVEELVQEGRLTAEQAAVHPQRSIITRALGLDEGVDVDETTVALQPGDRLLLCSDGLTGMVAADDIAATLRREPDPAHAAQALVDAANRAGGEDNITVVIVGIDDEGPDAPADGAGAGAAVAADGAGVAGAGPDLAGAPAASAPSPAPTAEPALERATATDAASPSGDDGAPRGRRAVTRVLLWALPIVVVLGIAVAAVGIYARHGYYVGLRGSRVTVFKGVPGGLAGWDPTVARTTQLTTGDLTPADLAVVRAHRRFATLGGAEDLVHRLERHAAAAATTTTAPTTTTTAPTTTAPGAAPAGP